MRSNRNTRLGLAAIAVALILLGIYAILRSRQPATPAPADTVADNGAPAETVSTRNEMAVFARVNIPERTLLTADMLELRPLDEGRQGNFVRDMENGALGFITRQAIRPGVPLEQRYLLGHISEVGIAGALLPGRRAMVVPIANKATLHDLVRIGDRIDILASFDQQEARTIVQNVRVLAVDVFGGDYPPVKVAMRGDYKAPPRGISAANPASPPAGSQPNGPIDENAPAAPTPTPQPTPPANRPEAALTVEVTPDQAVAISLAQSSGTNLDFTLRPHDEVVLAGGTAGTGTPGAIGAAGTTAAAPIAASITRARLAPGAESVRRRGGGATPTTPARTASSGGGGGGGGGRNYSPLPMPEPGIPSPQGPMTVPPMPPTGQTAAAPTYEIPIYGDGKLVRTDTVRKPQD